MRLIVPIKRFDVAKQRLRKAFAPAQRQALARAMARHVLTEISGVPGLESVTVATSEAEMAALARHLGFSILPDADDGRGFNATVERAIRVVAGAADCEVGVVSADLPLFSSSSLSAMLRAHRDGEGHQVSLVADRYGEGTNALMLRPGSVIGPSYGERSALRHAEAARQANVAFARHDFTSLSLDLDHPDDVEPILEAASTIGAAHRPAVDMLAEWTAIKTIGEAVT